MESDRLGNPRPFGSVFFFNPMPMEIEMDTTNETFQTTDLNVAAALWAAGAEFIKAEALSHRTVQFAFCPRILCEGLSKQFWTGTLALSVKDFADRQRTLKDILFGKLRDGNGESTWRKTSRPPKPE
jgi:hypothetical protein